LVLGGKGGGPECWALVSQKRGGDPISPVEGGDKSQGGKGSPPSTTPFQKGLKGAEWENGHLLWLIREGPPKDQDRGKWNGK